MMKKKERKLFKKFLQILLNDTQNLFSKIVISTKNTQKYVCNSNNKLYHKIISNVMNCIIIVLCIVLLYFFFPIGFQCFALIAGTVDLKPFSVAACYPDFVVAGWPGLQRHGF